MARRALLVGSQTGGLTGVHGDVDVMAETLESLGFVTQRATGSDARLDGIRDAYRGLIEQSTADDTALFYYSGHGGRYANPFAAQDPSAPPWLQFLVPTDLDAHEGDGFRGLLSDELSLLQWQLTGATRNVITILDCCHSARMSRNDALLPKADVRPRRFPWDAVKARWASVAAEVGDAGIDVESNPHAVRVVACAPEQSAYELAVTSLGGVHGALTAVLVSRLCDVGDRALSWRQLMNVVRPEVMGLATQRPEVEGPADRYLFSLEARSDTGVLPVLVDGGEAFLDAASLFGVGLDDRYALVAPGGDPRQPLATGTVDRLAADRAHLSLDGANVTIPAGAEAHPVHVALGRRPVAIIPAENLGREALVTALRHSPHLRIADPGEQGLLATVELAADGAHLRDAGGEPLNGAALAFDGGLAARLGADLQQLARAAHVRDLDSGTGESRMPEGVSVSFSLQDAAGEIALERDGEHLFEGDRVLVRIRNDSGARVYFSLFDVGLRGKVDLLTKAEPSGVGVEAHGEVVIERLAGGALRGVRLAWPSGLPRGGPRPELLAVIVSDRPQDLRALEQPGARRGARGSRLQELVEAVAGGTRDASLGGDDAPEEVVRYAVERLDFLLHPSARPAAEGTTFEIDERPDPSLRLVIPRAAAGVPPKQVAVRLAEVVVHSNRALLSSTVRVDALVVTRRTDAGGTPYQAATARFDRVKDGDRLPLDNLLVYDGPVDSFVDLAVWIARDDKNEVELAELLQAEASSKDVKGAVIALAGLAVAAPQAAIVAGTVAAVATLVRTGARLLDKATGKSIGVYRTSLLPHERLGAGEPSRRHPAQGLLRAQDMSFAYEIIETG